MTFGGGGRGGSSGLEEAAAAMLVAEPAAPAGCFVELVEAGLGRDRSADVVAGTAVRA